MNKVCVFSVIFPSIQQFLDDFFISLQKQTYKKFDAYLINDCLMNFNDYKKKYKDLNIIEVEYSNTPAKIREYGLKKLKKYNYDIIVFCDADDFFHENRIEIAVQYLINHQIAVNDLAIVNNNGTIIDNNYLSHQFKNNEKISFEYIKEKNFLGFSNTSIKCELLENFLFNKDLIAVDWYFFSILLLKGYKAIFTNETVSYYRQHDLNTVGMKKHDKSSILNGLKVKQMHYKFLAKSDKKFIYYSNCYKELINKINSSNEFINKYMNFIKKNNIDYPLWWENIKIMG